MTTAVSFDFESRTSESLDLGDVDTAVAGGRYCWIDFDDRGTAARALPELGIEEDSIARLEFDHRVCQTRHDASCIHCVLVEAEMSGDSLRFKPVHVFLTEHCLTTVHDGQSTLIDSVLGTYEQDFLTTAKTGGFLLFELADHLIIGYRETLAALAAKVAAIQRRLLGDVGDEILLDVSRLTRALLEFRNAVVSGRETVDELATRRSRFVQASTQPFLDRQTVPLDRLAQDAATERTVLSEILNLYMGIVSHRTNKVVNRLTVVSMILLPLNFLAAVYGMNFGEMPELAWQYGYLGFWGVSALLVIVLLAIFRRKKWI